MSEIKDKKIDLDPKEFKEKLDNVVNALKEKLGEEFMDNIKTMVERKATGFAYLFIICAVIISLLFVFFGYKLYKSLTDRERRKEEKRKQKQQKKKK